MHENHCEIGRNRVNIVASTRIRYAGIDEIV